MKTAVVFYSLSGNTRFVAERLAAELPADLIEIKPQKAYPDAGFKKYFWGGKSAVMGETPKLLPYDFAAGEYERVILGTPLWAGTVAPPLTSFIKENAAALTGKRIAVFICCSGGSTEKALTKLHGLMGAEEFEAQLLLVDPLDKPSSEKERAITAFCAHLQ